MELQSIRLYGSYISSDLNGQKKGTRGRGKKKKKMRNGQSAQSSCSVVGIWADEVCCGQPRIRCRKQLLHQAEKAWRTRGMNWDRLFADYVTQVHEVHSRVIPFFLLQVQWLARPNTVGSRENIGHSVHCVRRCKDEDTFIECQRWGHQTKVESGWQTGNHNPRPPQSPKDGPWQIYCMLLIRILFYHMSKNLSHFCFFKAFDVTVNIFSISTSLLHMLSQRFFFSFVILVSRYFQFANLG